jgi:ribosomal-protein-alanine N-acetyltransferase
MFSNHCTTDGFHIRPMGQQDMPRMLAIEHASFSYPWSEQNFLRALGQGCTTGIVAEVVWPRWSSVPHVVGFALCEMHQRHLHLTNLAVDQDWRRCGIGRHLIETLADSFGDKGRNQLVLEVRETNVGAQLFFRRCGFRAVSLMRQSFANTDESAYRMTRPLHALEVTR